MGIDDVLDDVAQRMADIIMRRLLEGGESGWIDQNQSPLGSRRHCAAVQRRKRLGLEGASIVGRRHLLSRDALAEELARLSDERERKIGGQPVPAQALPPRESAVAELARELKLIRGKSKS